MAEGLAFNQRKVRCLQNECKYFGVERTASLPIVSGGLFVDAMVVCECGMAPHVTEIPDPPKKGK